MLTVITSVPNNDHKQKAPEGAFALATGRWNKPEPIRRDAMQGAFRRRVLNVREPESNAAARPYGRFLHAHAAHVAHPTHAAAWHTAASRFVFRRFSDHGFSREQQACD